MKKGRFLMTILILLIFCTACKAKDPENLFEIQVTEAEMPATSAPESETTLPAQIQETVSLSVPYQYGNMQKGVPSGNFMRYGDAVLFTCADETKGSPILYTYDMATGNVSLFCKDATCTHNFSECASAGINCNLEQYNGEIFGTQFPGPVMKLKNNRFEPIIDGGVSHFWHSGGNLYVVTEDASLLVYENGSSKPCVLLEEYSGFWETIFDGYLYFSSAYNVNRIDLRAEKPQKEVLIKGSDFLTDGQYIYYTPIEEDFHLYRCNMDGSDPMLILDKPVLSGWANFDEEYFYFRLYTDLELDGSGSNELYRFPKSDPTRIEKIAELDECVGTVYTVPGSDVIFVTTYGADNIYVMAPDGSNPQKLEFPDY